MLDVKDGGAGAVASESSTREDAGFLESGSSEQVTLPEYLSLPIVKRKSSSAGLLTASF